MFSRILLHLPSLSRFLTVLEILHERVRARNSILLGTTKENRVETGKKSVKGRGNFEKQLCLAKICLLDTPEIRAKNSVPVARREHEVSDECSVRRSMKR